MMTITTFAGCEKKQEKLDQDINLAAIDMATDSILKADKLKKIEDIENTMKKKQKIQ